MFNAFEFCCYAVPHNNQCTLLLENINLNFVLQQAFFLRTLILFSSPHASFYSFISERDYTPLQCFYEGCTQSNQGLALTRLMHSTHCGSAVFPSA
jgi:hypothetical protein